MQFSLTMQESITVNVNHDGEFNIFNRSCKYNGILITSKNELSDGFTEYIFQQLPASRRFSGQEINVNFWHAGCDILDSHYMSIYSSTYTNTGQLKFVYESTDIMDPIECPF